jgi:alkylhydroperoxidase family enzyme
MLLLRRCFALTRIDLFRLVLLPLSLPAAFGSPALAESKPRLPLLSNEAAWKRLPGAPRSAEPLPAWARMLAGRLPMTTARMLELDALHRTGDRLDARLRCLVRWAAADANGCAYSKAVALADLRRAGGGEADLREAASPERLPALDRAAVLFARKMMREAHAVTDAEFKQLLGLAGEARVVALVALLAHASFQDRVLLALNPPAEPGGALPPLTVAFARPKAKPPAGPPRATKVVPPAADAKSQAGGADWLALQQELEKQRGRALRLRVPSREEVLRRIGEKHPGAWQADILWSRVCYGYQPELTDAWFGCVAAFRQESEWDPVFSQSIFWVVTRSLKCFY